ncbi:hypothetical protein [Paenibacillus spongiae]|uniref:YopX protein domain-containing protein n=1 Tax=Paenibacillus spongiae TaxID=2909671 RepID=A0ABY5SG88_9BACL|nr:hypothetical protein [Paenibacillus spongiae]UVI32996.1 hypothetical protein L1F29_14675 [Paenibacillus spongiae]
MNGGIHLQAAKHNLVSFPYNKRYWQMFVFDYFEDNRDQYRVIERNGDRLGVFVHNTFCDGIMGTYMMDLTEGVSWMEVVPYVNGYLIDYGDRLLADQGREVGAVTYSLREGQSGL